MQYTSKVALLAIALFGTSALAAPYADAEYEVEAREVDNELAAREFYDMYLEAREDSSLDARDVEEMDLEAREYLEYLDARAAATETPQTPTTPSTPQTPLSPHSSSLEASHGHSASSEHIYLTPHQKSLRKLRKAAAKKFKNVEAYHSALIDEENKFHRYAVIKHLSNPKNLKKALSNKHSPYHKAAKRILHQHKAKAYLSHRKNFRKALKHKKNIYHKDAVAKYFTIGDNFEHALLHKSAKFHKNAVHAYLMDKKTRQKAIADEHSAFHKQAVKLQKKINKHHLKHHKATSTSSSSSATATPTGASKA
jgi:hypothetical protein